MTREIDFSKLILDINDEPLKVRAEEGEETNSLCLGEVCCNALLGQLPGDDKQDGTQRIKRFNLARKIKGSSDDDDFPALVLNSKQRTLVMGLIEKAYPSPTIYARAYEAIEGDLAEEEE